MLGLPNRTEISKPIYKKDLLLRFDGSPSAKSRLDREIGMIKVVNEISQRTVLIHPGETIKAFFVIEIEAKSSTLSSSTVQALFDYIKQNIILVFRYEDLIKIGLFYKKIFLTDWLDSGYKLNIDGLDLDEAWANIINLIGNIHKTETESFEDAIDRKITNDEIDKKIAVLERRMRSTKTPARKIEIYSKILELRKEKGI